MTLSPTFQPLSHEIAFRDPCEIFSLLHQQIGAVFLDSAEERQHCGEYSFIALDPFQILNSKNGLISYQDQTRLANPFEVLCQEINRFRLDPVPGLPPFQGGVVGYLAYEAAQYLEKLPLAAIDELEFPDLMMGFYDVVLGFDLRQKRAWIFSSGFPLQEQAQRQERAQQRRDWILNLLSGWSEQELTVAPTQMGLSVTANFPAIAYQQQIKKVIDYILAGDIFQANLSQRFRADLPPNFEPFALYQRLRKINPAPFAAYLHFADSFLISASPERFLKLNGVEVETRPIKGTRPRGASPEQDQHWARELLESVKDRAENVMIVDLLRNDLSKVCEPHSVQVPQLCGLETYSSVHHLVSVIKGRLRQNLQALDLLQACFPGGSITGAPKIRAMEIIAELEPTQRGPYCGSVVYLGFDGSMDSSVIIRSFSIRDNRLSFQAGGAIVADSNPLQEQAEVMVKARALFAALGCAQHDFAY